MTKKPKTGRKSYLILCLFAVWTPWVKTKNTVLGVHKKVGVEMDGERQKKDGLRSLKEGRERGQESSVRGKEKHHLIRSSGKEE